MALTLEKLRLHLRAGWASSLTAGGVWGIGYDVATSDGKTSNPSSIVVRQQTGKHATEWLALSFKSRDPKDSLLILHTVASDVRTAGHHLRRCCVDASNERYHATNVRAALRGICPVAGIAGGDVLKWANEYHKAKQLLGSLYIEDYDDNLITIPRGEFIRADRRLVKFRGGTYVADTDDKGRHGDTFDAGKLAKWACIGKGGKTEVSTPAGNLRSSPHGGDSRTTALHPSVRPSRFRIAV